jgi:hypothetical protein
MNKEILKSVKNIMTISEDMSDVNAFAREKFNEKFKDKQGVWYKGYIILNENTLRVEYGGGDMEIDSEFDIEL